MNDMALSDQLPFLEKVFADVIAKTKPYRYLEHALEVRLSNSVFSTHEYKFLVSIVKSKPSDEFFGMRLYPVIEELDSMLRDNLAIQKNVSLSKICDKWKTIRKWYLEIDEKLLTQKDIIFTPKEIIAILLHELGHVVLSNDVMTSYYRTYKMGLRDLTGGQRLALGKMYFMYMIPCYIACAQHKWNKVKPTRHEADIDEVNADNFTIDYGYGDYLISVINKIIKKYGSTNIISNDSMDEAKLAESMKWCNLNVSSFIYRKDRLKDDIYAKSLLNRGIIKRVYARIMKKMGIKLRENYTGSVVESSLSLLDMDDTKFKYSPIYDINKSSFYTVAVESALRTTNDQYLAELPATEAFFRRNKKLKVPSQYDLDEISIEIDKISNHHDRIFVLDLIYKKIDEVEAFKLNEHEYTKYKNVIDKMLAELDGMREAVLAKKNFAKNYSLFVKYPDGYEG